MSAAPIALHGADAAAHDYHAGRAGSFDDALAAIRAARAAGDAVVVTTAITRSSYRVLAALPPLLHAHGVAAWRLTLARHDDRWGQPPRLGLALPFALHAIDRAARLGLTVAIIDAPRCLLGRFDAHAVVEIRRAHPPPCEGCAARPRCAGIDAAYAARFGTDELTAQ